MDWFRTLRSAEDPAARLVAMFDVLRSWFDSADFHGCAFMNAAGEIKQAEHDVFQVSRHHKMRLLKFIEECCADAGAADPPSLARQSLVLVDGAIAVALVSGDASTAADARAAAACVVAATLRCCDESNGCARPPLRGSGANAGASEQRRNRR